MKPSRASITGIAGTEPTTAITTIPGDTIGTDGTGATLVSGPGGTAITGGGMTRVTPAGAIGTMVFGGGRTLTPMWSMFITTANILPPPMPRRPRENPRPQ